MKTLYCIRNSGQFELWEVKGSIATYLAFRDNLVGEKWRRSRIPGIKFALEQFNKWEDRTQEISKEEAVMILFGALPFS